MWACGRVVGFSAATKFGNLPLFMMTPSTSSNVSMLLTRSASSAVHRKVLPARTKTIMPLDKPKKPVDKEEELKEFRHVYPDLLPSRLYGRRNWLAEKLERMDMLRRRVHIDVPEFYVGSILAVTLSDSYTPSRINRFVGICIFRGMVGLRHCFTLRNSIDGLGVEVQYDMYNPLVRKIEVLRLEKRLDSHLLFLRDALPQYSYVPFDMEPIAHSKGALVPINETKVKMMDPPWSRRWDIMQFKGVDESCWELVTPYFKRKFARKAPLMMNTEKYDIMAQYRDEIPMDDQREIIQDIVDFEDNLSTVKKRPVFGTRRSRR